MDAKIAPQGVTIAREFAPTIPNIARRQHLVRFTGAMPSVTTASGGLAPSPTPGAVEVGPNKGRAVVQGREYQRVSRCSDCGRFGTVSPAKELIPKN